MKLKLIAVRLSFPALLKPRGFDENTAEEDKRFEATFLMEKDGHADLLKQIRSAANQMLKDKYGANVPKGFKFCLRDGIEREDTPGYGAGIMFIGSNSPKRPVLVDQAVRNVPEAKINDVFYAGCYVNASVRLWIQDNKWGKRINCEVLALQKHSDGEPFGEAPVDPNAEFEAIDADATNAFGGDDSILDGDDDAGGLL